MTNIIDWWFRPFVAKTKTPPEAEKASERTIVFRDNDNMYQRAENIWYGLGFVNDHLGEIPRIAYWLTMYRDWDNTSIKKKDSNNNE